MRRLLLLPFALFALPLLAQPSDKMTSKVFVVLNRPASDVASAVSLLGSGYGRAAMHVNNELKTLTVRDFPENVAAVEEAIKHLDVPAVERAAQLHVSLLIASNTPGDAAVPEELEPVIRELRATLPYSHYALVASAVQRVGGGMQSEASGIVAGPLLGTSTQPANYHFKLRKPSVSGGALAAEEFDFHMRVPIDVGARTDFSEAGFATPATLRDGETAVIGTTAIGDKALIVVASARIGGK